MTAKSHNEIPQALSKRKIMLVGGTLALLVGLGLAYGISGYETNPRPVPTRGIETALER